MLKWLYGSPVRFTRDAFIVPPPFLGAFHRFSHSDTYPCVEFCQKCSRHGFVVHENRATALHGVQNNAESPASPAACGGGGEARLRSVQGAHTLTRRHFGVSLPRHGEYHKIRPHVFSRIYRAGGSHALAGDKRWLREKRWR